MYVGGMAGGGGWGWNSPGYAPRSRIPGSKSQLIQIHGCRYCMIDTTFHVYTLLYRGKPCNLLSSQDTGQWGWSLWIIILDKRHGLQWSRSRQHTGPAAESMAPISAFLHRLSQQISALCHFVGLEWWYLLVSLTFISLTSIRLSNFLSFHRPLCPLHKCPALSSVLEGKEWAAETRSLDSPELTFYSGERCGPFSSSVPIWLAAAFRVMQRNHAGSGDAGMGREHLGEASLRKPEPSKNLGETTPGSGPRRTSVRKERGRSDFGDEAKGQVLYTLSLGEKSLFAFPQEDWKNWMGSQGREWPHMEMFPEPWDEWKEGSQARVSWVM